MGYTLFLQGPKALALTTSTGQACHTPQLKMLEAATRPEGKGCCPNRSNHLLDSVFKSS